MYILSPNHPSPYDLARYRHTTDFPALVFVYLQKRLLWGGSQREKNIFMMSLSLIFPLALVHDRVDSKTIDATPAVLCVGWSRLFVKSEKMFIHISNLILLSPSLFLPSSLGSHLNRRSDNDDDSFRALSSSLLFVVEMNCVRSKKNCASHKTKKNLLP